MELSRSTYYFEIGKKDLVTLRNEDLLKTIVAIFNKNKGRYGVRRVHHELIHLGYIAYDLSLSPNLEQIKRMLNKAFERYPHLEGLIFHSDQGWQYQHDYYQNALKEPGITQSMSRKGNCYDNSIMESFFGRMKNEE